MKYYVEYNINTGLKISSYSVSDSEVLNKIELDTARIEITESEYATNLIDEVKIASGIADAILKRKDINNIDKLQKAGFLVIMDYLRSLGLTKTNGQFKNDVITKYETIS